MKFLSKVALTRDELLQLVRYHHEEAMRAMSPKFLTSTTEELPLDFGTLDKAQQHIERAREFSKIADGMYKEKTAKEEGEQQ